MSEVFADFVVNKPKLKVALKTLENDRSNFTADMASNKVSTKQPTLKIRVKSFSSQDFKLLTNKEHVTEDSVSRKVEVNAESKDGTDGKMKGPVLSTSPAVIPKQRRGCRKKQSTTPPPQDQPLNLVKREKGSSSQVANVVTSKLPATSNVCRFCGKFYATAKELEEHELQHTVNKELCCPQCGMGFARRSYLAEHACIHNGVKPFECYYCSRAFTLRCNLVRHTRIHTGEKPFICNICKKGFILKKNMIEHRRTHTGEKPFKCEHCIQRFSRRSSLVRHFRIHTKEKSYECHECHKTFSWKYYLRRHMAVHLQKKNRKKRRRQPKKVAVAVVKPQEMNRVDCSPPDGDWFPENFVEHSYAASTSEQTYPIDDNNLEVKEENDGECSEENKFKEEVYDCEDAVNPEVVVPQRSRQLTVLVSPIIIEAESLAEGPASSSSMEIDVTPTEQNDIISFKMTKTEFESFCGRRLRVRLHRLEDLPPLELHEE